jgi:hypothetical protein
MIDQILKEHKTGDKPRFFLHDEIKAWLQDHLYLVIKGGINRSADMETAQKLGLKQGIPAGFYIELAVMLNGDVVTTAARNITMTEIPEAFSHARVGMAPVYGIPG